eukprot:363739_1
MLSLIIVLETLAFYALGQPGISYPKDQCDWIGADGMHGAYLPIGVCKHIFDPHNLTNPEDDHLYSHKYICRDDGTVKAHAYGHDTTCHGEYSELDVPTYGDDYYKCSGQGTCPYAVVRFYHQEEPYSEQCIKSTDGWYSEAPMTTYQCLNITKEGVNEWYMLKCTQDGKGLIGIDYTENCKQKLNESVMYNGCNYKDLWVEIAHCDHWDEVTIPFIRDITTSTPIISTTQSETTVATNNILTQIISKISTQIIVSSSSDSDEGYYGHHSDSHDGYHHHHDHRYGEHSDEYHSHDRYHDGYHGESQDIDKEEGIAWPIWFHIAVGVGLLFMLLCCYMTYKYMKQKRQMETFAKIVEFTMDIEGDVNEEDNTIVVDEGETITFK